ncbi:MAG: hypothetical protein JJ867_15570, partial [Marinobacter sp.]|nr:hypothetical protein [Marinobacter sp.]
MHHEESQRMGAGWLAISLLFALTASGQTLTVQGDAGRYRLNHLIDYSVGDEQSLDQALQRGQWQAKQDDSVLNLGFTDQSVWLRVSLNIPEPLNRQWYLVIPYPLLEEVDLFILRDRQQPPIYHTSREESEHRRQQPRSYQVALPLPRDLQGDLQLVLRARSATSLQVPLELWREDRLLTQFSLRSLYWGGYFGVLCALVIYNLFLFLSLRD